MEGVDFASAAERAGTHQDGCARRQNSRIFDKRGIGELRFRLKGDDGEAAFGQCAAILRVLFEGEFEAWNPKIDSGQAVGEVWCWKTNDGVPEQAMFPLEESSHRRTEGVLNRGPRPPLVDTGPSIEQVLPPAVVAAAQHAHDLAAGVE